MTKIANLTLALAVVLGMSLAPAMVGASVFDGACDGTDSALCDQSTQDSAPAFIVALVNLLLYGLGAVSVVMIIFAGVFYVTSQGEPAIIKRAKDSLLYAVIGLIVALSAYAIVNFVLASIIGATP
jgi:hypothetical protein